MANRRKTIVINKKFQYQHALLVVALVVIIVNVAILGSAALPSENSISLDFKTAFLIGVTELLVVCATWFITVKTTHRIAGPVYVFARQLKAFSDGDLDARIRLRKHDSFQDEASTINACLDEIRDKVDRIEKGVSEMEGISGLSTQATTTLQKVRGDINALMKTES